jgi:hypothetical protein
MNDNVIKSDTWKQALVRSWMIMLSRVTLENKL